MVLPSPGNTADIQTGRNDHWAAFHNPASLCGTNDWQVGMQYENRYLLAVLNTVMVQAAWTNPWVNIGVGYSFYGYGKYHEMATQIALSHKWGICSVGLSGNYLCIYAGDEWKYKGMFVPQIGLTIDATEQLTVGISTFNPVGQRIRLEENIYRRLPQIYSVGLDYRFWEHLRWTFQGDWDVTTTWRVATAMEWQAMDALLISLGAYYRTRFVGCIGVGTRWNGLSVNANVQLDPQLGLLCGCRVSYLCGINQ